MRRACDELYGTRSLALVAPGRALGLARALERRLADDNQLRITSVTLGPGEAAVPCIAAALSMHEATPAALAMASALADTVAVVSCKTVARSDEELAKLMRMTAAAALRAPSLAVVLVGEGLPGLPRTIEARTVVDPLDAAAHAASLPLDYDVFCRRLVASVAVEVAAWDLDLLERLAALPIDKAVRPDEHVSDWLDERHERWHGRPKIWEEGSLDRWGDEDAPHPLWLAANQPAGLRERVWRGQVGVLLPWLETRRRDVIAAHCSVLRPDSSCGPDVEDLEWGALGYQLGTKPTPPPVQALRYLRNALAHGQPAAWPRIKRARDDWQAWRDRGTSHTLGRQHSHGSNKR